MQRFNKGLEIIQETAIQNTHQKSNEPAWHRN